MLLKFYTFWCVVIFVIVQKHLILFWTHFGSCRGIMRHCAV